jgi:hypothetical protein
MSIRETLYNSFDAVRYSLVYLLLAPFLAFGMLLAGVIISLAKLMEGIEILLGGVNLGSEFVKSVGVKLLPSFYPDEF